MTRSRGALLSERGHGPLPAGVTAHKLRHTFASLLDVRGEDPPYVMAQLGHAEAGFTLRVYAHAMRRDNGDKERLKALVEGRDWAPLGTSEGQTAPEHDSAEAPGNDGTRNPETSKPRRCRGFGRWARRVSNLRPLACEASALPLSYAPGAAALQRARRILGEGEPSAESRS